MRTAVGSKSRAAAALLSVALLAAACGPTSHRRAADRAPSTTAVSSDAATTTTTSTVTIPGVSVPPSAPPPDAMTLPGGPLAPVISRVQTTDKVVFITIDDGLVRDPKVAELITAMHLPVTLFLIDGLATEGRAYFQSIVDAGGTVEDHTLHHPQLTKLGYDRQHDEICGAAGHLSTLFAHQVHLFRPPYGSYNATTRKATRDCGLDADILWRARMNDGRLDAPGGLHPGDIILTHFRKDLFMNLKVLLNKLAEDGLAVGRLESYLLPGETPTSVAIGGRSTVPSDTTTTVGSLDTVPSEDQPPPAEASTTVPRPTTVPTHPSTTTTAPHATTSTTEPATSTTTSTSTSIVAATTSTTTP